MEELTVADLPERPSDKVIQWANECILGNAHALVYRSGWYPRDPLTGLKTECVDAHCSICGTVSKLPKLSSYGCRSSYAPAPFGFLDVHNQPTISGESTLCPSCGGPAKALHIGRINDFFILANCWPLEIQAIKGRLVLICWYIKREVNKSGVESISTFPYLAFVVEKRKINYFSGYVKWFTTLSLLGHWERRSTYKDHFGKMNEIYPWNKCLLKGTTAENSKLDLYLRCKGSLYPVSYLKLWLRRPQVENLLMQGVGNVLAELIYRDCSSSGYYSGAVNIPHLKSVNWTDKRPAQMLGLTKEEFQFAKQQRWTLSILELYRDLKESGHKVRLSEDMPLIAKCGALNVRKLMKSECGCSLMRVVRYLVKQERCDATTLVDYWRLVSINGGDISDDVVRFPQNLHRAHDQQSERQRFEKEKGYHEYFARRTESLSAYSYESDGLLIRPVLSAEELYKEGKQLHHCVYSYLTSHATGATAIMLIRSAEAPERPFFTLELDEKTMSVRQNRGFKNCGRTPEVKAFEEKWLEWAKAQKAKKREENVA